MTEAFIQKEREEAEEREELEADRYATHVRQQALALSIAHLGGEKRRDGGFNPPEQIIEVADVYLRYMLGENLEPESE